MIEIQSDIRKFSETTDWQFQKESQDLYRVGEKMMQRFFNGLEYLDGRKVPAPVFAFDDLRNYNTLAQYHLLPDEYGIMYRITMNTQQYSDGKWRYGEIAKYETVLHEMVHTWQQHGRGKEPFKPGAKETHNKEFVKKCNELGLHPKQGPGYHVAPPDKDSPFGILMKDLGIEWDVPSFFEPGKKAWFIIVDTGKRGERKGTSTLNKWTCPECGINARIGVKGNPEIVHDPCSVKKGEKVFFVRADGLSHIIYEG